MTEFNPTIPTKIIDNPISEYITVILGAIGLFFLGNSFSILLNPSGGFGDIAAILAIFMQIIAVSLAFPFLLKGFGRLFVLKWFAQIVLGISALNAIIMAALGFMTPNRNTISISVFLIIALLELIPFVIYNSNKDRII